MDKILIKRGTKEKLEKSSPLSQGELFLARDEERLYVGGPKGNIPIATQKEVDEKHQEVTTQLAQKAKQSEVDALTGRVSTVENTIQQHAGMIESKIDDKQARSIFHQEASSFTFIKNENGYTKLPNGLILQWGVNYFLNTDVLRTITFPIAFPNECLNAIVVPQYNGDNWRSTINHYTIGQIFNNRFTVYYYLGHSSDPQPPTAGGAIRWMAIGY